MQAADVATDEQVEQLMVKPFRIAGDFLNSQSRLDVEQVAHVARLKIEVHDANLAMRRGFVGLEVGRNLDRERRVADATGAWNERNDARLRTTGG